MACSTRKKLVRWCGISGLEEEEEEDNIQCLETGKCFNPSILIYVEPRHGNVDSKCDK